MDDLQDDDTPTNSRYPASPTNQQLHLVTEHTDPLHYSPIDPRNNPFANSPASNARSSSEYEVYHNQQPDSTVDSMLANELNEVSRGYTPQPPVPSYANKPYLHLVNSRGSSSSPDDNEPMEDRWTLPSQRRGQMPDGNGAGNPYGATAPAPLRVANRSSVGEGRKEEANSKKEEDEWARDYMGYMGTGGVSGHYGA